MADESERIARDQEDVFAQLDTLQLIGLFISLFFITIHAFELFLMCCSCQAIVKKNSLIVFLLTALFYGFYLLIAIFVLFSKQGQLCLSEDYAISNTVITSGKALII